MQATKDTFLKTLSNRLAVVNPARTVMIDGSARPAVLALENETPLLPTATLDTFLLTWAGAAKAMPEGPLMYLDCKISYGTEGSNGMLRTDRGRVLTAMDTELLQSCRPNFAHKCDYTLTPQSLLGTNIFWTAPMMEAPVEVNGILQRTATIRLFFFPEVA
jgi:hypothetical protein